MCLCISEVNDSIDTKDGREILGLFCDYKAYILSMKWRNPFESRPELTVNVYCELKGND